MIKRKKISAFNIVLAIFMAILCFIFIIPFWIILVASFSDNILLMKNGISLWFQGFDFAGYKLLFGLSDKFIRSLGVSLISSLVSACLSVIVCTMAAYVLSKKYLIGRKFFSVFLTITMFFSGGTIPTYLVIRNIGLYNTIWALILPGVVTAYPILLVRNYLCSITPTLEEAAQLDGAGDIAVFWYVYVPLSVPIMCTIGCMTFISKLPGTLLK